MTFGNEIKERNLDWTQVKIENVAYADEMTYIVEFNFSSGVSIRENVKLDVVGRLCVFCKTWFSSWVFT